MTPVRTRKLMTLDMLEGRRLFSADLLGDVLSITGTRQADVIRLSFRTVTAGDNSRVDQVSVDVNGEVGAFNLDDVARILVKADRRADRLRIDQSLGQLPRVGFAPDTANTATLARDVLNIDGSGKGDIIEVSRNARRGGDYVVNINGAVSTFSVAGVSRILVFGNRRDDTIMIGQSGARFLAGVFVQGGDGNDQIIGGGGNDTIDGGLGTDVLTGGDGNDQFFAGADAIVNGGAGDDHLQTFWAGVQFTGGAGHDMLTSGGSPATALRIFVDFDGAEDRYAIVPAS